VARKRESRTAPKRVEGRLPYVFDLHWDCKTAEDLERDPALIGDRDVQRMLAENGYDVREWLGRKGIKL
jgi:hypothetical protein